MALPGLHKFIVTIRDGKIIDKLDMHVRADTAEDAEAIGDKLIAAMDPSAYVDGVFEAA